MRIEQLQYLKHQIEYIVGAVEIWEKWLRRLSFAVAVLTSVLAATVTVLLGWQDLAEPNQAKNIALLLSACISVISAFEAFFQPRKNIEQARLSIERLRSLQRDIDFETQGVSEENIRNLDLMRFKKDFDLIINEAQSGWVKALGEAPKKP